MPPLRNSFFHLICLLAGALALVHCSALGTSTKDGAKITFSEKVTFSNIEPSMGYGGDTVTVHGSGFTPGPFTVYFADVEAAVLTYSETEIIATVPVIESSGSRPVTVRVVNADGDEVSFIDAFDYRNTNTNCTGPSIASFTPSSAFNNGTIAVTGSGFVADTPGKDGTRITIGSLQADIVDAVTSSLMTVSVPNLNLVCNQGEPCPMAVVVINPDGCMASATSTFIFKPDNLDSDDDDVSDLQELLDGTDPANPNDVDFDRDGVSKLTDCDDRNGLRYPGNLGDIWENGVDLDCKPDKLTCVSVFPSPAQYPRDYKAEIFLNATTYEPYSITSSGGYNNATLCRGTFSGLSGNQSCTLSLAYYGTWHVSKLSATRFKLSIEVLGDTGQECQVGD